jgi:hypothetical protein
MANEGAHLLSDRFITSGRQHAIDSIDACLSPPVVVVVGHLIIKQGFVSTRVGVLR